MAQMPPPSNLSEKAIALNPSLTLAISARAKALIGQGRDICSLSAGEPDFDTPGFIVEAAIKALREGITRYGPAAGDPELREAVATKLTRVNQIPTHFNEVLITNGGKQAIYNLLQIILNPDDEVLIPAPYWLSYPEMVRLAGAKPVCLDSSPEKGFQLDFDLLESSINKKTRLIILNSPGNPSGRVMPLEEMKVISEILKKHQQIMVLSDEIYEFLLADGHIHQSFAAIAPELKQRIFTVNGFAKGWAMTGWRVGYLSGNQEVIKAAIALQSQSTSNVCSFAQRGALAALQGSFECVKDMAKSYNKRRELLTKGLRSLQGITLIPPKGAFYAFPQLPQECTGSIDFCNRALEEVGLAIVPGAAFGQDRCVRISCAVSEKAISDGLNRLSDLLSLNHH